MSNAIKRLSDISMLSCAFVSAILGYTAFLSQNGVAGSSEVEWAQSVQAQPRLRLAQNTGAAGKTDPNAALEALIKADEEKRAQAERATGKTDAVISGEQKLSAGAEADGKGQMSVLAAAAKASQGKEAPIPAIDEETLSLYPTAAHCGER